MVTLTTTAHRTLVLKVGDRLPALADGEMLVEVKVTEGPLDAEGLEWVRRELYPLLSSRRERRWF